MHLIVGLGNPGLSYKKSRHNAGFMAIDALCLKTGISVRQKGFSSLYGEGAIAGERVVILKPQTYMNLSGNAVIQALNYYKIPLENLIVIYDDIELPLGRLRIRDHGSAGTHNGMRSIIQCVHGEGFPRIRIGMGHDESLTLVDFVLKKPSKEEFKILNVSFEQAAEAAILAVQGRLCEAQAKFN